MPPRALWALAKGPAEGGRSRPTPRPWLKEGGGIRLLGMPGGIRLGIPGGGIKLFGMLGGGIKLLGMP